VDIFELHKDEKDEEDGFVWVSPAIGRGWSLLARGSVCLHLFKPW